MCMDTVAYGPKGRETCCTRLLLYCCVWAKMQGCLLHYTTAIVVLVMLGWCMIDGFTPVVFVNLMGDGRMHNCSSAGGAASLFSVKKGHRTGFDWGDSSIC